MRSDAHPQALASRLFQSALGAAELLTSYIGLRLGLYERLASDGPLSAPALAACAGVAERYALEWLEQQAAAGILVVDNPRKEPRARRYTLPPGHAEVLVDSESALWMAPLAMMPVAALGPVLPKLLHAYRSGEGVPYAEYGPEFREGQAGLNRITFLRDVPGWIAVAMPDVDARLRCTQARIADVACGSGWSSIGLAHAYPLARIDAFDLDESSIAQARSTSLREGVSERVTFSACDASCVAAAGSYDLVCIFDALHDMSNPVPVLQGCRRLLAPGGACLLMEPKAAERFTVPASETERLLYAISVLHCLPVGLADQPSAATGTLLRPQVVRSYASQAGFSGLSVLPIEHGMHRLYRLDNGLTASAS